MDRQVIQCLVSSVYSISCYSIGKHYLKMRCFDSGLSGNTVFGINCM